MMNRKLYILVAIMFFGLCGKAQEYLVGFGNGAGTRDGQQRIVYNDNVATLPFFDDFTELGNSPSQQRWQGYCVFTNSGFPYLPVNYRAATLDLVDEQGAVYNNGSSSPFIADSLMSVAIRLDSLDGRALTPADSLYLSFYYQAGGYGDAPDKNDSLVLCFGYGYDELVVDPETGFEVVYERTAWKHIWSTGGMDFDSTFTKVMIPITDTCFFKERFYILFYNYGTLPTTMYPNERSNMDMWNIDFVYLNAGRTSNPFIKEDTYPKVSLTGQKPLMLKRYSSMPYRQYAETSPEVSMNYFIPVFATNLDSMNHQVHYYCDVENNSNGTVYHVNDTAFLLNQYLTDGVTAHNVLLKNFRFPDNIQDDSASFTIRQYIDVVDQYGTAVAGDSIVSSQGFYNYFAYDDGIPEKGYGLTPDDTYMATQFNVATPDKLYGVQLLFNQTYNDANFNFFDIYVWGNNDGKPGNAIYVLENQRPIWSENIYEFAYYEFDDPVTVNGTFYVGIRQQEKKSINIGFDTSRDCSAYNFFKVNSYWESSQFSGALMIRPVVGSNYYIGIDENQDVVTDLQLSPNPVSSVLHLNGINADECSEIIVYDLTGRTVMNVRYSNELNVSDLDSGVYVIRIINHDGSSLSSKFIVSR